VSCVRETRALHWSSDPRTSTRKAVRLGSCGRVWVLSWCFPEGIELPGRSDRFRVSLAISIGYLAVPRGLLNRNQVKYMDWQTYPRGDFELQRFFGELANLDPRLRNLRQAPRCGARTGGTLCQRPAIRGRKRCRLHGGLSPSAPRGPKNGNFRNGDWTAEAIEERKWLRSLVQSPGWRPVAAG
jgi:hypothetical protein